MTDSYDARDMFYQASKQKWASQYEDEISETIKKVLGIDDLTHASFDDMSDFLVLRSQVERMLNRNRED